MRTGVVVIALLLAACSRAAPPKPPATADDPQLIELGVEPTAGKVLAGVEAALAVRIRISAARLPPSRRPPLNLTLVIDTSGSMEGEAIASARAAARGLVERLSAGDRIAVVTFASTAQVLVPSTELAVISRAAVLASIGRIEARGTTDLASGLARGLEQARLGRRAGSIDRIVLLGDGVPNDGAPIPGLVAAAQAEHLPIATLGLGLEFDEALLGSIALETGGHYTFAKDPDRVATAFADELFEMRQVVGKNLALSVTAGPGVTLVAMPGFAPVGGGLYASLGDLAAGDTLDVIIPVHLAGHRDGATVELVDARLSFDDAALGAGPQSRAAFTSVKADADVAAVSASIVVDAARSQARTLAASAILDAISHARAGDRAGAEAIVDTAEPIARTAATQLADPELTELADRMLDLRRDLAAIAAAGRAALAMPMPSSAAPAAAAFAADEVEDRTRASHERATRVLRR